MAYKLNEKERQSVFALPPQARYEHFLSRVVDWEELWSLKSAAGFAAMADEHGNNGVPFWPHPDYAELVATALLPDHRPERIPLNAFIERWLSGMARDKRSAIVFPTPDARGTVVDPRKLLADLETKLEEIE